MNKLQRTGLLMVLSGFFTLSLERMSKYALVTQYAWTEPVEWLILILGAVLFLVDWRKE